MVYWIITLHGDTYVNFVLESYCHMLSICIAFVWALLLEYSFYPNGYRWREPAPGVAGLAGWLDVQFPLPLPETTRCRWRKGTCTVKLRRPRRVAQQNAIHIPRPLFPFICCTSKRNSGLPNIITVISGTTDSVVFCLGTNKKTECSVLYAPYCFWVCYSLREQATRYRTVI
jgi:hypothetical protein